MKQIRKILELYLQPEPMSIRTISKATGVSRPVIKQYIELSQTHKLKLEAVRSLSDSELAQAMHLDTPVVQETPENKVLLDWLEDHVSDLQKVGMTRKRLHENYLIRHPGGLQYSQFCYVLGHRYQTPEASSLLSHKAGDKLYVDFTGKKALWIDQDGHIHTEEVFLAVLGASGYLVSYPLFSQKQADFATALVDAFHALGGVPRAVVPDCLKSAVLENDGWEPVVNPLFQKVMDHYHTVCLPARPGEPKDKAPAEGAVNLIYRQILSRLPDQVFSGRREMLLWWQKMVENINDAAFQKLPGSRSIRFQEIDRPALKSLPDTRFSVLVFSSQTVASTGVVYISQDKTYYSVPYSLQGNKVEVLTFADRIEVWHENQRRAVHLRQPGTGQVILKEHRAPEHQKYEDRGDEYEIRRNLNLRGTHVVQWASRMGDRQDHEDQKWRIIHGLLNLADKYPHRIDWVCRLALREENWTLKYLRQIIKSEADIELSTAEQQNLELAFGDGELCPAGHENIRGSEHYIRQLEEVQK